MGEDKNFIEQSVELADHLAEKRKEEREKYPEHHKLQKVSGVSQEIGQFLEWLQSEKDFVLAKYGSKIKDEACRNEVNKEEALKLRDSELYHQYISIPKILAEYFNIDLDKIDEEKNLMLEEIRKLNKSKEKE